MPHRTWILSICAHCGSLIWDSFHIPLVYILILCDLQIHKLCHHPWWNFIKTKPDTMFWIWSKYSWNLNIWVSFVLGSSFEICTEFEADLNLDLKKHVKGSFWHGMTQTYPIILLIYFFYRIHHCQLWQTGVKKSQLLKSRSKKHVHGKEDSWEIPEDW